MTSVLESDSWLTFRADRADAAILGRELSSSMAELSSGSGLTARGAGVSSGSDCEIMLLKLLPLLRGGFVID